MEKDLTKKDIKRLLIRNSSFMTVDEGYLLYNLAKSCNGNIVEIGSYKGGSAIILAKGLKDPFKVYAIDPHDHTDFFRKNNCIENEIKTGKITIPRYTYNYFNENIKRENLEKKIIPIIKTSEKANKNWKNKFSLLWIDGNHDFEGIKLDFLLWERYLKILGMIALHDTKDSDKIMPYNNSRHINYPGPRIITKEKIINSNRFKEVRTIDSITYAKKVKESNIIEKFRDHVDIIQMKKQTRLSNFLFKTILKLDNILGKIARKIQ